MRKVIKILTALFWTFLIGPAVIYVGCDILECDVSLLADTGSQTKFVVSTVMILLTLALVPLALRLFNFGSVKADLLERQDIALLKWGKLRLFILGELLFANTLLYYLFGFEPAYGYLAIVVLLTFPFVYPTEKRCMAETGLAEPDMEQEAPDNTVKEEEEAE